MITPMLRPDCSPRSPRTQATPGTSTSTSPSSPRRAPAARLLRRHILGVLERLPVPPAVHQEPDDALLITYGWRRASPPIRTARCRLPFDTGNRRTHPRAVGPVAGVGPGTHGHPARRGDAGLRASGSMPAPVTSSSSTSAPRRGPRRAGGRSASPTSTSNCSTPPTRRSSIGIRSRCATSPSASRRRRRRDQPRRRPEGDAVGRLVGDKGGAQVVEALDVGRCRRGRPSSSPATSTSDRSPLRRRCRGPPIPRPER